METDQQLHMHQMWLICIGDSDTKPLQDNVNVVRRSFTGIMCIRPDGELVTDAADGRRVMCKNIH